MSEELIKSTQDLDLKTSQIAHDIIKEDNVDTIKDLTHLFNLNQAKKNVIRLMKLNGLLDTVSDKIIERFEKYPDNFSNEDLIKYLQVTENAIDKANKNLSLVDDTPIIQVNHNNQVNVNLIDTCDKESKERILDFVNSVLNMEKCQDVTEIQEDEVKTDE